MKYRLFVLLAIFFCINIYAENTEKICDLVLKLSEQNDTPNNYKDLTFLNGAGSLPVFLVINESSNIEINYVEAGKRKWISKFLETYNDALKINQTDDSNVDCLAAKYISILKVLKINDDGDTKGNLIIFEKLEDGSFSKVYNIMLSGSGDDEFIESERPIEAFENMAKALTRTMKKQKVSVPLVFKSYYKELDLVGRATDNKNFMNRGHFPEYRVLANRIDTLLFEENEKGEIVFSEVVETSLKKEEILDEVQGWLKELEQKDVIDISDVAQRQNTYSCIVTLGVGKIGVSWSVWGANVASYTKDKSEVIFLFKIEAKDNVYRYTLSDFYTERRRVHGAAKEHGQSNEIHFHRLFHMKGDKLPQEEIDDEKLQYREERKAVEGFILTLKEEIGKENTDF